MFDLQQVTTLFTLVNDLVQFILLIAT